MAANLLAGSLIGAWTGATWAIRMRSTTLYRVLAALLVLIAVALVTGDTGTVGTLSLSPVVQAVTGVAAGFLIGVVAALMGVAGGELLIPTIVLLYGTDIKPAGSLSLAVSLPTMLVAFARYSRDGSFTVPDAVLLPVLAVLLLLSAGKVWQHRWSRGRCSRHLSCSSFRPSS